MPDTLLIGKREAEDVLGISELWFDLLVTVIVVAGIPGSGKTTLATSLGRVMGLSVISKDVIKESMMDSLGTGDNEWASTLSRAAHDVMYRLVGHLAGDVVLDAHFHSGTAEPELQALGEQLIQVYCRCSIDIAWRRYEIRRDDPSRHPGHLPEHQDDRATAGWRTTAPRPLSLDAPLVEVDTSRRVDVEALAQEINHLMPDG